MWFSFGFTFWGKLNKCSNEILIHFFGYFSFSKLWNNVVLKDMIGLVKKYHSYYWELECFACLVFFLHVGILFAFIYWLHGGFARSLSCKIHEFVFHKHVYDKGFSLKITFALSKNKQMFRSILDFVTTLICKTTSIGVEVFWMYDYFSFLLGFCLPSFDDCIFVL